MPTNLKLVSLLFLLCGQALLNSCAKPAYFNGTIEYRLLIPVLSWMWTAFLSLNLIKVNAGITTAITKTGFMQMIPLPIIIMESQENASHK